MNLLSQGRSLKKISLLGAGLAVLGIVFVQAPRVAAQTCATTTSPATTYGQVKQNVSVATAGTYRIWSRIKAPDTTNNSFYLQVDNGCAIVVGDAASGIPANTWTWVDYQNGTTASHVDLNLPAGTHQLTYTGKEPNVQLDRVELLADLSCVPNGTGDNCINVPTNPTISITSPANNAPYTKGTSVNVATTVSSNTVKVDFLIDGTVVNTDTTAPFSYTWNTSSATVAPHSISARAYDASNNTGSATPVTVNITNQVTDTIHPAIGITVSPSTVNVNSPVTITADARDNIAVAKVEFYADGTLIGSQTMSTPGPQWAPTMTWTPTTTGPKTITAIAYDTSNLSTTSAAMTITVNGNPGQVVGDIGGGPGGAPDGRVNGLDFGILVGHMGQNYTPADLNNDGTVSAADLAILLGHWTR